MASPITVGTTPVLLITVNTKRKNVIFQNNGKEEIYVKRWPPGTPAPIPSATNYDFILCPDKEEGTLCGEIFSTESISAFVAVSGKNTAPVGVTETVKVALI